MWQEGGLGQSLLCLQEELRVKGALTPWKPGPAKGTFWLKEFEFIVLL